MMQDAVEKLVPESNVISLEKPQRMAQGARSMAK